MKLNEAIEKLIENPTDVYECFLGSRYELSVSDMGFFRLRAFDGSKEIDSRSGAGGFTGNLTVNSNWQLICKPVTFMEAVNSGKNFKPESWVWETDDKFRSLYDNLEMFSGRGMVQVQILNGKWLIE